MITTITLAGTKLSIKKDTHDVFVIDGNERSARLKAWSHVSGSLEKVFAACDDHGRDCYVILSRDEYDASAPPQYARTANDDKLIQEAKELKERREEARRNREQREDEETKLFHFVPRECRGVDFGTKQRILAFNETAMVVHKPGYSYHGGRFEGPTYSRAEVLIMSCKIEQGKPVYAGPSSKYHLGQNLELASFRFGKRCIRLIKPMMVKFIPVPAKHRDAWKNWYGQNTLDLRERQ